MKYSNILEEELKNKVAQDFFAEFDCSAIIEKIDFSVKKKNSEEYLLWAEAKAAASDIFIMLAQLVLTVGKARTFDKLLPPPFLGCFDREKIAFIPYHEIQEIFYQNDFNWNVAPSNHETKEFKQVYEKIKETLNGEDTYIFNFETDEKELVTFIKENFVAGKTETSKIQIDKNNFVAVYIKWLEKVKPTIIVNWDVAKKHSIIDGDFYLADLLSRENKTLQEKLFVLLKTNYYELDKKLDDSGFFSNKTAEFSDKQKAHTEFWAKYERPPKEDYWDYILLRRVLLVPQDVRERKGAFFTPPQWVAKAHEYLAKTFGENWQDEYYVWDNSAGSGNLLVGLVNKDNIWASTLDKADVDLMHERIENGANLWKEQVFQFDFLNDDFVPKSKGGKLPDELFEIINDPKKRKKLMFLINPPYGECGTGWGRNSKAGVKFSKTAERFREILGGATLNEKYVQFFVRIYADVPDCKMAAFVQPKYICGSYMKNFHKYWKAKYLGGFATPSGTHDNCKKGYPICLFIWDLAQKKDFPQKLSCDVFNEKEKCDGVKNFINYDNNPFVNKWISQFKNNAETEIGYLAGTNSNDFEHNNAIFIINREQQLANPRGIWMNQHNLIFSCIFFAVRKVVSHTWLNDRDQFLYPNGKWETDKEFQNDCLAYTLFHDQSKISIKQGVNHWIPFSEKEINAKYKFESHFMLSFISGKVIKNNYSDLFEQGGSKWCEKREFSPEATAVFDAGRDLWKYYHSQKDANPNAAFYDIREYFQGRNTLGRMNSKSEDEKYCELIANLREKMKVLAKKIEPKIYEYGFLLR